MREHGWSKGKTLKILVSLHSYINIIMTLQLQDILTMICEKLTNKKTYASNMATDYSQQF